MSLRVVQHLLHLDGMPSTPRGTRSSQRAIAAHDTEGEVGEQGAWNTISWMHATAPQRNASYNELWAFNEATGELLVIVVVPSSHAAHSIAPQPTSSTSGLPLYEPDALVRSTLGTVVNDPNMWVYAVSIAGRVADVDRYAKDSRFVEAARQRTAQLGYGPLLEHFRFNPRTRSDWGRTLTPTILKEPNVADIDAFNLETIVIDAFANVREAPDPNAPILFQTKEKERRVSVGTKNGHHAYWSNWKNRWGYTSTEHNVLSREPYPQTVEVVKEVPTGITEAQLDAAKSAAFVDAKTKARLAVEAIKP